MYDYITQGAIIRSRATRYELGGRNNKYFLNLENSKRKKEHRAESVEQGSQRSSQDFFRGTHDSPN